MSVFAMTLFTLNFHLLHQSNNFVIKSLKNYIYNKIIKFIDDVF